MHRAAELDRLRDGFACSTGVPWTTYPRGGRFAAHNVPDVLVDDVRGFFAGLGQV